MSSKVQYERIATARMEAVSSAFEDTTFDSRHTSSTNRVADIDTVISLVAGRRESNSALNERLAMNVGVLDLTSWQKEKLSELGLSTVRDILLAPESKLLTAYYVGPVRAQQMRKAALAAVLEYLSG